MRPVSSLLLAALLVSPCFPQKSEALDDPITRLAKRLDSGDVTLEYRRDGTGYLRGLLKLLGVNVDSQVLVFSKTSFQAAKISPEAPRALYFNDSVSVGSVQTGEVLELASVDPKQGVIFYTLDAAENPKPRFERRGVCLQCHQGAGELYVPGIMVSSVYPGLDGTPLFTGGELAVTDHRTPFDDRWGGWYVTGTHGSQRHMGNAVAPDPMRPGDLQVSGTQNLTSLAGRFDTSKYLEPTSDIVALMTLEHQTRMTNLITSLATLSRTASSDKISALKLEAALEETVAYLVFADEPRLLEPVTGSSTFTKTFPLRGPRDSRGRSLRDFDLRTRLFRYPLSYMIYSEAFAALPLPVREHLYTRVHEVLANQDRSPRFARLSPADRLAALQILEATSGQLPAPWSVQVNGQANGQANVPVRTTAQE